MQLHYASLVETEGEGGTADPEVAPTDGSLLPERSGDTKTPRSTPYTQLPYIPKEVHSPGTPTSRFILSDTFGYTGECNDSPVIPDSQAIPDSQPPPDGTALFPQSDSFTASAGFHPSDTLIPPRTRTDIPTPPPSDTPLGEGVSIVYEDSITIVESITQSETEFFVSSLSQTVVGVTMTVSHFIFSDNIGSRTLSATVQSFALLSEIQISWVTVGMMDIPIYVTRMVRVSHAILLPQSDAPSSGLSSGALIGIVSGSAVVLAILVGVAIFLLRHRKESEDGGSSDDEKTKETSKVVSVETDTSVDEPDAPDVENALKQFEKQETFELGSDTGEHSQELYL